MRDPNAIYDDDPHAIEKLEAKIADLEKQRDRIKWVNAEFRKRKIDLRKIEPEKWAERLEPLNLTPLEIRQIGSAMHAFSYGRGFEPYHLTNLGSNIGRCRKRLARLRADRQAVSA